MDRVKFIIVLEGYVISAVALAAAVTMISNEIAWPMGYVIAVTSVALLAMSLVASARLRRT